MDHARRRPSALEQLERAGVAADPIALAQLPAAVDSRWGPVAMTRAARRQAVHPVISSSRRVDLIPPRRTTSASVDPRADGVDERGIMSNTIASGDGRGASSYIPDDDLRLAIHWNLDRGVTFLNTARSAPLRGGSRTDAWRARRREPVAFCRHDPKPRSRARDAIGASSCRSGRPRLLQNATTAQIVARSLRLSPATSRAARHAYPAARTPQPWLTSGRALVTARSNPGRDARGRATPYGGRRTRTRTS